MNATVPLEEAIPWSVDIARKILICDSVETDGSFLLHSFANQVLKASGGHSVWWVTGRPVTDRQIATALKKVGSDVAATYLRNTSSSTARGTLHITNLVSQIMSTLLENLTSDCESVLRNFYKQIKEWVSLSEAENKGCCWILLDDVSSLASIAGEALVFQFLDSLVALATRAKSVGLLVRCSSELEQTLLRQSQVDESQDKTGWLGAGGYALKHETKRLQQEWAPWERTIDLMDISVDVVPLSSGYSREAHGRLVFTECPAGRGWSKGVNDKIEQGSGLISATAIAPWNRFVINYCLQDGGVRAIRLRENASKT